MDAELRRSPAQRRAAVLLHPGRRGGCIEHRGSRRCALADAGNRDAGALAECVRSAIRVAYCAALDFAESVAVECARGGIERDLICASVGNLERRADDFHDAGALDSSKRGDLTRAHRVTLGYLLPLARSL